MGAPWKRRFHEIAIGNHPFWVLPGMYRITETMESNPWKKSPRYPWLTEPENGEPWNRNTLRFGGDCTPLHHPLTR